MQFLCAPFPHLCLICQPPCVYIYIDFSAAALGHCSVSSPSYLSLKLPLQRGSPGQDRSCQHPGALGKDASMGGRGQRVSIPWHHAAGKEWDLAGCECLCIFISPRKYKEETITGSFTNYLIPLSKRNSASFGNMQWKRVKRTFGIKWSFIRPDYVLKK